ncbi:MAG: TRAP transporter substrate-binding protein DctP, partial [Deltaproteobacteria bacterium]|nr:TRAP transporter substrate-binding protein DctP [Deltaproteobacteria bacterium]
MKSRRVVWFVVALSVSVLAGTWSVVPAQAGKLRLKASHQFAEGDVRDQMIKVFGQKVSDKLKGQVTIRTYPAKSLYKPKAQWDAMKQGALDMSCFPLDYASGKVPQLSITLMPCAVTSMQQAQDWRKKEIGKRVEKLCEENGVKILIWAWLAGGPASTVRQIKTPADVKGLKMRAAGKKFEYM